MSSKKLFWTCPFCDANLDFGERCDCLDTEQGRQKILDDTRERINKLHEETMQLLGGKK